MPESLSRLASDRGSPRSVQLSLILATYGRADELARAIESFLAQSDRGFELIVVDQNTDRRIDPYVRLARDAGLEVLHLRADRPGLSAARNLGMQHARHEIFAFPDDDCWYEHDVVHQVRQAFEADPTIGGVIARWVEDGVAGAPQEQAPLDPAQFRRFRGAHASSITLFLTRAALEQLGGFDERLGVGGWYGGGEDTDIVLRALARGARFKYVPTVRVHHPRAASTEGSIHSICQAARIRSRGAGAIYSKHGLSMLVVLRGFLAPVIKSLASFSPALVAKGLFIAFGRIEGFMRWKYRES